jgi:hypothetical protein
LKFKLTILITLLTSCIAFCANEIENVEIVLKGNYSFKDIIAETENQLGIDINLPSAADTNTRKNYNQTISLEILIKAIMNNYAQESIPVDWKYKNHILEVFRTDKIKRKIKAKSVYKKPTRIKKPESTNQNRRDQRKQTHSIFDHSTNKKQNSYPARPQWTEISKTNNTQIASQKNSIVDMSNDSELVSFEQPKGSSFTVVMPTKKREPPYPKKKQPVYFKKSPSNPSTNYTKNSINLSPRKTTKPTRTAPLPNTNHIKVTPYPEDATAFINDAPSISQYTGSEIYIEWETRMKGALQQRNHKVLNEEKAELEKRLRWLKRKL